ncbi:beta-lactamase (plasmid) [Gemmatirosa kalamazoonensis]|uniref:Beta-lactamase n=1 Tax=Gemmatirosa kalamazoonensis TaxID=861299 RepID=W0RPU7_9BACT|nr:serine hydrolase domain-containing protein [Gemmatirosa kalamazoonensis]AHG93029.1 beta-lactamase [Gemmatirosa kalamazoonensis]
MHRLSRLTALLVVLPGALGAQHADPLPARVDSIATRVLAATGVPSASVAVVRHDSIVYAQAYGLARLDPRTPATPAMRYGIGSISKQFTAAAVLLLQEEGKLRLDDPVERWVPGLTRGRDVTIRQLLSHTSGYQDFWPQDYVPPEMQRPVSADAILARWAKRPLDFEPGTRWQYSNTNFVIAALAVEKASGVPFWQFVKTRLLDPLGIAAVDFDTRGPSAVEPQGYLRYGLGPLRPAIPTGAGWMWGAGELAMTARDLAAWDRSVIEQRLLRPESYRELERDVLLASGVSSGYGLGVDVGTTAGHRAISHGGEVAGFVAQNIVFPDDSAAVVVLTNQDATSAAGTIAQGVASLLFTTEDALTQGRAERARAIFAGLQKGTIDRSLFTPDANAYFSAQALADFAAGLAPLGTPTAFVQTGQSLRGGMTLRSYRATFPGRVLRVWTFETPDGKLEQYQIAPVG